MKIAKETWIIMAIGLADLATTILFIQHHGAEEANPLFQHYWKMGLAVFIGAKIVLLVAPLSILEWARQHRPQFVSWALRAGIAAYIVMYGVGYVRLNHNYNSADPEDAAFARYAAEGVRLPSHMSLHVRPVMQTTKQTSSAVRPVNIDPNVAVY